MFRLTSKKQPHKSKEALLLNQLDQIVDLQKSSIYEASSRLRETLNDYELLNEYAQDISKFILSTIRMYSLGTINSTTYENTFVGVSRSNLEEMRAYISSLEPVERMIVELKILDLEFKLVWHIIYQLEPKEVNINRIKTLRKELGFEPLEIVTRSLNNA